MKLRIAVLAAAVSIAGAALAQSDQPGVRIDRPLDLRNPDDSAQAMKTPALALARDEIHEACSVDMHALCGGKTGAAADRCLVYHRLSFSTPCRHAIADFQGKVTMGASETLVSFQPYSGERGPPRNGPPPARLQHRDHVGVTETGD
ncbi:MAG TPA: hypothetical protein VHW05_05410 [Phenylobacterium sp.]|jgi:hypothetical protein|nr:hypothetical protein [Phenylobacterium sp.]